MIHHQSDGITLLTGDALQVAQSMETGSVNCIVTSPPYYGLRDYGSDGQYGLEDTPAEYVESLVALFQELYRVLADDGTLWLNLGDSYGGGGIARPSGKWPENHDPDDRNNGKRRSFDQEKCLLGVPDMVSSALVGQRWVLRNRIIWVKDRPARSSASDRFGNQYESVFLFAKRVQRRPKYWFDSAMRTAGDVWKISFEAPDKSEIHTSHFAKFPVELPRRCIATGCKPGGTVLDPFSGSGTTGQAARELGMSYIGIDINPEYHDLALRTRLKEALV